MPLTPEDVSSKRFTAVRLREGYDMGEVDQFLDEVETELARLLKENDDLRAQLKSAPAAATAATTPAPTEAVKEPVKAVEPSEGAAAEAATATEAAKEAPSTEAPSKETPSKETQPAAADGAPQVLKVTTTAEASSAAARLLELATNNADQLVGEAKSEAERIVGEAKVKAERHESDSKSRADKLESDARSRAQMLDGETADRRKQLFGDLEKEQGRLTTEIEGLRAFEREYRSRLKSYFTQQLESLDSAESHSEPSTSGSDGAPRRAKSPLGVD